MLENLSLKTNFVGKDGYFWWIGQIVEEKYWKENISSRPTEDEKSFGGFDYRYKVRILGYHPPNVDDLSDEQLPWASIMLPVTAGAGSGGASQSPNLRQGNFVHGFFLDGEDAQHPIITGVFGYNEYVKLERNSPIDPLTSFSGFNYKEDFVPYYSLSVNDKIGSLTDDKIFESINFLDQGVTGSDLALHFTETEPEVEAKDIDCDQERTDVIKETLKNALNKKQKLEKSKSNWKTWVSTRYSNASNKIDELSGGLDFIEAEIDRTMRDAQEKITGEIKIINDNIQRNTNQKINEAMAKAYSKVFPGALPDLKKEADKANNDLSCAFRNIGANLFKMVGKFLNNAMNKLINAPLCAINNMVGSLLGNLSGIIDGAVGAILAPLKSLLSSLGGVTDVIDDLTGVATGALSFLSCGQTPSCSDVKSWSASGGIVGPDIAAVLNVPDIISKAKGIASGVQNSIEQFKNIGDSIKGVADGIDFSDVIGDAVSDCFVGPLRCGPPTIQFFGGGGSGAAGNAIISTAGTLLGVDIILPGSGYSSPPLVSFVDSCGKGGGASGTAVISNGEVVNVIINDTGSDYLTSPDGSQGGDGTTWAEADETTVKRADGTYDTPYQPGTVITVCPGDKVTEPGGNEVIITGQNCKEITAKSPTDTPVPTGDYPVILTIDSVNVVDGGFGYDCSKDKVVIEPANGAELSICGCTSLGVINKICVNNGGSGFTDEPEIYIQSDSGYNAKLVPTFNITRVEEEAPSVDVIQVVDCVGKF